MGPQGTPSALGQAQSLAQQFQKLQQQQQPGVGQVGPQQQPGQVPQGVPQVAPNQLPDFMQQQIGGAAGQGIGQVGGQQAPGDPNAISASFQQHSQNPKVQQALQTIGQFLGQIGHPLANMFQGGLAGAAGQGAQAIGNMYQQAAQGSQGQTLNTQPGMTAPGVGPVGQSLTGGNPPGMGQQPLNIAGAR